MDMISDIIILLSYFYIWFMPALLAYALYLIVASIKKGENSKSNFIFLGVVLYFIIIPIFCMLWHIVDYK